MKWSNWAEASTLVSAPVLVGMGYEADVLNTRKQSPASLWDPGCSAQGPFQVFLTAWCVGSCVCIDQSCL